MRLSFVFILLFALTTGFEFEFLAPTTAPDTNKLCLYLDNLTLNGVEFKSPQMKWVQTEGIFYVYNPTDSMATFKSKKFPIFAQKSEKTQQSSSSESQSDSLSTTFTFIGDESIVGCWIEPDFKQLNIRFKLYEFYHTALKAVSVISISNTSQTLNMELNTLPYQYADANVIVDTTLQWLKDLKQSIALAPPPPIAPIESNSANMDTFDSEEITDDIITADKEEMDMENVSEIADNAGASTDWMFIAALCSSMLGLFILIYICIWAYKTYGRQEYESIPSLDKSSKMSGKFGGLRKISLRNIGIKKNDNEEVKGIMHPSASYTFDD